MHNIMGRERIAWLGDRQGCIPDGPKTKDHAGRDRILVAAESLSDRVGAEWQGLEAALIRSEIAGKIDAEIIQSQVGD